MLGDIRKVEHIYIACGYTDLRRGIDGLAQIVQNQFLLDPCSNSLFLFCGRRLAGSGLGSDAERTVAAGSAARR